TTQELTNDRAREFIGQDHKLFIGGEWVDPQGSGRIEVTSPSTGEVIGYAPDGSEEDIDRAVQAARRCFDDSDWPHLGFVERVAHLNRAADVFDKHVERIAEVTADESGLPFHTTAMDHGRLIPYLLRASAELGAKLAEEEERPGAFTKVTLRREPVGVVGAITPWNAPAVMAHFTIPPALMAGCAVVLKTAPESPLHGQILGSIYEEVGLPPGVINIVPAGRAASESLVRHPGVDKIAFTGSTATGQRVGAICGELFKRRTLELGGKSAAIILDDANLPEIMPSLVAASVMNNCQACLGQTRILAPENRYDEVVRAYAEEIRKIKVGDPFDPATQVGPLISQQARDKAERYIELGKSEGATLVTGGGRPAEPARGWYVEPTVFRDVSNKMRIAREEIFGPVFVVIPYKDDADAIRIANDSDYGLSGSVWTSDVERGRAVARKIRTGHCGINVHMFEFSAPFGGYKKSGLGREFGEEGLSEFFEFKQINEKIA
ncbi:MAG TPA: aldehyde dehydrogenase, partial [Caulobacteraceae bacterium]|nr:aldehyde dehydrogenase [Caulobacteraceae bacterium]